MRNESIAELYRILKEHNLAREMKMVEEACVEMLNEYKSNNGGI